VPCDRVESSSCDHPIDHVLVRSWERLTLVILLNFFPYNRAQISRRRMHMKRTTNMQTITGGIPSQRVTAELCAKGGNLTDLVISEGDLEEGCNACQQTLEIRKKALAVCLLLFFIAAGGSLQSLSAAPASITIAVTQVLTRPDSGQRQFTIS
jgi:hypothetical protein